MCYKCGHNSCGGCNGLTVPMASGPAGVGISNIIFNNDGTMTIFLSNGSSYTSPSLIGPPGQDGTDGQNGLPGTNGIVLLEAKGPQPSLFVNIDFDVCVNFLTVPLNTLKVGDKLIVTFLMQLDNITLYPAGGVLSPEISISSSVTGTLPTVGGTIPPNFAFIGPVENFKDKDFFRCQYTFTRHSQDPLSNLNAISIEGVYMVTPDTVNSVSQSYLNPPKLIHRYSNTFPNILDNTFYFTINVGTSHASLSTELKYASVELIKKS